MEKLFAVHTGFIRVPQASPENSDALALAQRYHPSGYYAAFRALRFVRKTYAARALVDLGCGAGRILILASAAGYPEVAGVELDPDLAHAAKINFESFSKRFRRNSKLTVQVGSAGDFCLADASCAIFLFNPFGSAIFEQFLTLNAVQVQNLDLDLTFILINPRVGEVLERHGFCVVREWRHSEFSRTIRIYRRKMS